MKKGNVFYLEFTRKLWIEPYKNLSQNAKWLYATLKELEHRYCGDNPYDNKTNFFYRSNEDLAKDAEMSLPTLKRAKKELLTTDLLQSWQTHFIDNRTGKTSEKHITAYRIY